MSFPRYPKYKPSGVEWLGEVPEHWEVKRLKHIASGPIKNGLGAASDMAEPAFPRYIRITDIAGPRTLADESFRSLPPEIATQAPLHLGDVLFACVGATFGKSYLHCTDIGPACYAGYLAKFSPSTDTESRFISFWSQSDQYWSQLNANVIQSTVQNFSASKYQELKIARPTLAEQHAIAAFLDRETAKIDGLIAEQERLIELLKEKRQAVISHAVTKGLDPAAPMKPSGVEWLGEVPEHWEEIRFRALFRQTKRQDHDSKPVLSVYRDLGVVLKDSRDDNNNKTPEDLRLYQLVQPGDLVVNKMKAWQGSLGISSIEGITSPDYAVFVPRHAEEGDFLHLLLRSAAMVSQYLRISNGIRLDQWRLETDLFLNMRVFLPPRDEQRSIAENLGRKLGRVDGLAAEAERAITLLTERRSALISAAVTGQIDVRNAVPQEAA
jgi:type I restriction enzyme S subunit